MLFAAPGCRNNRAGGIPKRHLAGLLCLGLLVSLPTLKAAAVTVASAHENLKAAARGRQSTRPPVTVWERMRDPRGWWQSRLAKTNLPGPSSRVQSLASSPRPFAGAEITNPIFLIPPTFDSGGTHGGSVAIGDFNGDGRADLLVTNGCVSDSDCTQGTVAVLLGNGDGTYQPALVSPTGAVLASVAVGDFNRDGKLDVAVNNACPDVGCTSGSVHVLLGNGNGTFQAPVAYATGGSAFSVEAGDLNGDGKLDLVAVNGPGSAGVLLGNGDGTFQAVSTVITSAAGNSAVYLGDFNGDNKLDLAVVTSNCGATQCDTSVSVLRGNGDGSFQGPAGSRSFTGRNVQAVGLGDTNRDGKLDLALVLTCPTSACLNETVEVLLGKGDGTFGAVKSSELATEDVTFVGFADLNGDGKPEMTTVDPDEEIATVMLGKGDGTFTFLGAYETDGTSPLFGALGDLNGDGRTDFAVANLCQVNFENACAGNVIALLGDGHGFFDGPVGYPSGNNPVLATADLNHDGTPDLADAIICESLSDCSDSRLLVFLGRPSGTLQPPVTYDPGGYSPTALAAGDFNGDGKQDLVVIDGCVALSDCSHGVIAVLLGNGDGTLRAPLKYPSGGYSPLSVATGDFNGDGKLDLAVVQCPDSTSCLNGSNGSVSVLLGNGDGSFASAVNFSSGGPYADAVTAADFNGDGKLDLVVANGNCINGDSAVSCQTGSVGVLLGKGNGSFQNAVTYSTVDAQAFSLAAGDFNGDGKLESLTLASMVRLPSCWETGTAPSRPGHPIQRETCGLGSFRTPGRTAWLRAT